MTILTLASMDTASRPPTEHDGAGIPGGGLSEARLRGVVAERLKRCVSCFARLSESPFWPALGRPTYNNQGVVLERVANALNLEERDRLRSRLEVFVEA